MSFPPASYGADSPQISYGQAEGYALAAGFPMNVAVILPAVGTAESGLRPARVQEGQPYALTGWGWLQITPGDSVPSVGVDQDLLDALVCAKAAKVKYDGQGLNAWATYSSGAYRQYLQQGVTPVLPSPTPQPVPSAKEVPMPGAVVTPDGLVHVYFVTTGGDAEEWVNDQKQKPPFPWSIYPLSVDARGAGLHVDPYVS